MTLKKDIFPIDEALSGLREALALKSRCILIAPPGAGKTTVVPPSLLEEPWLKDRKIIMLEPRRLAARRSAEYMAEQMGEKCGLTIGYRIRSETRISGKTRIEVVTEGILTRMLQSDAELPEAGLVIFDEFHERSIHADTGLAFMLDVQKTIRPDIKILLMSATPDTEKLLRLLDYPPVVQCHGRAYPVETHYLKHSSDKKVEVKTSEAVLSALKKEEGDILVFLPGKGEIRRTFNILNDRLHGSDVNVHELYGEVSKEEQDAALRPASDDRRRVILSTSIAETSLTIDGVRVVIDSGLSRLSSFDVRRGMPGLITVPVSKASADQRRGRAGRQQPGVCYRLWTVEEEKPHPDHTPAEILTADLTPLALELSKWGNSSAVGLLFPDPPPAVSLSQAASVLFMLGAIDSTGKLTPFGKRMSSLPVHPRLSAMVLRGSDMGLAAEACLVAALLEERDSKSSAGEIDLIEKLYAVVSPKGGQAGNLSRRVSEQAEKLRKAAGAEDNNINIEHAGILLALAYPERIARRKAGSQYLLAQGSAIAVPESSPLVRSEFLAIGDVDAAGAVARAFLAASISAEEILVVFKDIIVNEEIVEWADNAVRGKRRLKLGALSIQEKEFTPSEAEAEKCIINMIQSEGLKELPWNKDSIGLRERSEWYRHYVLDENDAEYSTWPGLNDEGLMNTIGEWLPPFLHGVRRKKEIDSLDMTAVIKAMFTHEQFSRLEKQAPASLKVPGGSSIKLRYNEGEKPVLAVKLQELFGQTDTPKIGNGRIPVLIHLLSPAQRPLAITQDLKSFWKNVYPEILKQMRIKYPKHIWPDDALSAAPTRGTKKGRR